MPFHDSVYTIQFIVVNEVTQDEIIKKEYNVIIWILSQEAVQPFAPWCIDITHQRRVDEFKVIGNCSDRFRIDIYLF